MTVNPPLRIVHTEASNGWGGQEIRILEEASGLIARGHQVTILCAVGAQIYQEASRYQVPVVALPIGKKRLQGLIAMWKWLRAHPTDVVNTHSSTDSWLVALAALCLPHAPAIVRTRHISAAINTRRTTRWLYQTATRYLVTTGEKLREALIRDNGYDATRMVSIPTGIDEQQFCPEPRAEACARLGLDPARRYIGIVATLRSWKGHTYLLQALARIADPTVHVLIVGNGPGWDLLHAEVAQLGLGERVHFAGQQHAVRDWFCAADIVALPSYANEGVPQSLLQAMLCARPIVTTNVGSIGEIIHHDQTGWIVPIRDAESLSQALQTLLANPLRAAELGAAAREVALAGYTKQHMLDRMEALFEHCRTGTDRVLPLAF